MGGKRVLVRTITGVLLTIFLFAVLYFQGWVLRLFLYALMLCSLVEVYSAFRARGDRPAQWAGLLFGALSMPLYLWKGESALGPLMVACCMLGLVNIILRGKVDFDSAVATVFPLLYPGMMIAFIYPLADLSSPVYTTMALCMAFLPALLGDVMAYEVGVRWGRRKLSPELSPNKSVEGSIAGLAGSAVAALICSLGAELILSYVPAAAPYRVALPPVWQMLIVGLLGGAFAQVGDLTASMVKRHCGIKDYGNLFPGHGGMMDRMDGVLFCSVVVYVYFVWICGGGAL